MSSHSNEENPNEAPGTISILSRDNTIHSPSLVHDIWEFTHDPYDEAIRNIISKPKYNVTSPIQPSKNCSQSPNHQSELKINHHNYEYGINNILQTNELQSQPQRQNRQFMNPLPKQLEAKIKEIVPEINQSYVGDLQRFREQPIENKIDVLEGQRITNTHHIINQTKELLFLQTIGLIQFEAQSLRKQLLKMEIDCRKLKIGLRSKSSFRQISSFRLKTSSNEKRNVSKGAQGWAKEKKLNEDIQREKRKMHELGTRQILLANYYKVMKAKKVNFQNSSKKPETRRSPNSKRVGNWRSQEGDEYFSILTNKKAILAESLSETQNHMRIKYGQIKSENRLLREQLQILELKLQQTSQKQREINNINARLSSRNAPLMKYKQKSQLKIHPYLHKGKRKLQIHQDKMNFQQNSYYQHKSQYLLGRVKSEKILSLVERQKRKNEHFGSYYEQKRY